MEIAYNKFRTQCAARIIQQFFHNYLCYTTEEMDDGTVWPVDPILKEPFDPQYMVRVLQPMIPYSRGGREKVHIFNIHSLLKCFSVTETIANPITNINFTFEQCRNIMDKAQEIKIISDVDGHNILKTYFHDEMYIQPLKNCVQQILSKNMEYALNFILENSLTYNHINYRFPVTEFEDISIVTEISPDIRKINIMLAVAMICPEEIPLLISLGGDINATDHSTNIGIPHILAKNRIDILMLYVGMIDPFQDSSIGTAYQLALDNGIDILTFA